MAVSSAALVGPGPVRGHCEATSAPMQGSFRARHCPIAEAHTQLFGLAKRTFTVLGPRQLSHLWLQRCPASQARQAGRNSELARWPAGPLALTAWLLSPEPVPTAARPHTSGVTCPTGWGLLQGHVVLNLHRESPVTGEGFMHTLPFKAVGSLCWFFEASVACLETGLYLCEPSPVQLASAHAAPQGRADLHVAWCSGCFMCESAWRPQKQGWSPSGQVFSGTPGRRRRVEGGARHIWPFLFSLPLPAACCLMWHFIQEATEAPCCWGAPAWRLGRITLQWFCHLIRSVSTSPPLPWDGSGEQPPLSCPACLCMHKSVCLVVFSHSGEHQLVCLLHGVSS